MELGLWERDGELGGSGQSLPSTAVRGTGALNRDPAVEAVLGVFGVEGPCGTRDPVVVDGVST